MFSEQRWDRLIMEFREENFRIYQLSAVSVFDTVLQDGLAALKTQYGSGGHTRGLAVGQAHIGKGVPLIPQGNWLSRNRDAHYMQG